MCTARFPRKPGSRGLTLVEMIIFIVIISIAVAGVLLVMNNTTSHSGDAQLRKQALAIAEGLLEEVEMARFTYCDPQDANVLTATSYTGCQSVPEGVGPESGNARPFDNVNDYVPSGGSLGTQYAFTISDVNSTAVTGFTGQYTAQLTISKASLPGMPPDSGANPAIGSALLITVKVSYGDNQSVTMEGYRTQYAPNLIP